MEEARKQLEMLNIFNEHPGLIKERDELRQEVNKLRGKISEKETEIVSLKQTSQIVDGENLTTPQLQARVSKLKDEEIQSKAKELFNSMKTTWEQGEKKKDVAKEAVAKLNAILGMLHGHPYRAEPNETDLLNTVMKTVRDGISKGIDQEFNRRVEAESNKKSDEKLKELLNVEWPNWFSTFAEPRAKELENKLNTSAITALKGPWEIICSKCGTHITNKELNGLEIESLLRHGFVDIPCQNPNCGFGLTQINVTLLELIESRLSHSG